MQSNLEKLSSYQNPEGLLKDRLAPRTDLRLPMFDPLWFKDKSVLDVGCNNGYFVRYALESGATRAVGVDKSGCIEGAKQLAQGTKAEFWQLDVESKEFKQFCPIFDTVLLLSVLTHLKDREGFLDWLDFHVREYLIFESNHGEKNKDHIELVKKHLWFDEVTYLGPSDIPEKPHHLWVCKRVNHHLRHKVVMSRSKLEFLPLADITGFEIDNVTNQKNKYDTNSDKFAALKKDIAERGVRDPLIVIERDGVFKGFQGAHRYWAAKQLGYKYVPCRVIRGHTFKHLKDRG